MVSRANNMRKTSGINYKKLFKLLIDRGEKKTVFAENAGINANTLAKLSKNEYVSMDVLARICRYLNCQISDIVEVMAEEDDT